MLKILTLLTFSLLLGSARCQFDSLGNFNFENAVEAVQGLAKTFSGNSTGFLTGVLGVSPTDPLAGMTKLLELQRKYAIGSECLQHMVAFFQALTDREDWATKMIDAIGKPPSGLMEGKIKWLGDFDGCKGVKATVYQNATAKTGPRELFTGKYCHVDYELDVPMNPLSPEKPAISIGVCFPDSCSASDGKAMFEILTSYVAPYLNRTMNISLPNPSSFTCQEDIPWNTRAIAILVVSSIFMFVMIVATLYDVIYVQWLAKKQMSKTEKPAPNNVYQNGVFEEESDKSAIEVISVDTIQTKLESKESQNGGHGIQNGGQSIQNGCYIAAKNGPEAHRQAVPELSPASRLLLSFSMFTNATKLLNTSQPKGALTAVNGIRFLSMSWVIVGHSYVFVPPSLDNAGPFFQEITSRFSFMPILNGTFSVDSFFLLSGLLMTYLTMKEMDKCKGAKNFKWGLFYFHRVWRLTPPYMLTLMVYAALNMYWGNGPVWPAKGMELNDCKNWWKNLLYLNTIVEPEKQCFGHSWYLANDMVYFVLSPLMLIPLFHLPAVGALMCMLFLAAGTISSGLISWHYDLPPAFHLNWLKLGPYMDKYYLRPWTRVGPYAVGVFVGYLLYRSKLKTKIPRWLNLGIWLVAATAGALVIYGIYADDGVTNPLSPEMSAAYNALSRSIWGACVAWVIYACATGNGGPVNHVLSWPGFVPLGRLSYCAYLIHPFMMSIHDLTIRQLIHAYDYSMIYLTLGHLCIAYATAFMVSLAFEAPMMGLEKVLLGRAKQS